MLLELVKYLAYSVNVRLFRVFSIDQNIIQVYDDKDILLLS